MAFGSHIENYSTAGSAMMSLFRALLGDFEYSAIQKVDSVAGPLLFVVYILLVGFILLNMFIAILAEVLQQYPVHLLLLARPCIDVVALSFPHIFPNLSTDVSGRRSSAVCIAGSRGEGICEGPLNQ